MYTFVNVEALRLRVAQIQEQHSTFNEASRTRLRLSRVRVIPAAEYGGPTEFEAV